MEKYSQYRDKGMQTPHATAGLSTNNPFYYRLWHCALLPSPGAVFWRIPTAAYPPLRPSGAHPHLRVSSLLLLLRLAPNRLPWQEGGLMADHGRAWVMVGGLAD